MSENLGPVPNSPRLLGAHVQKLSYLSLHSQEKLATVVPDRVGKGHHTVRYSLLPLRDRCSEPSLASNCLQPTV